MPKKKVYYPEGDIPPLISEDEVDKKEVVEVPVYFFMIADMLERVANELREIRKKL